MTALPRWVALPVAAAIAVAVVLGIQLARGGGTYEPLRSPPACADRTVDSQAEGLDGLTERLVLLGLADAACSLGVSREELTLQLAQQGPITDREVESLRSGLVAAVGEMKRDGSLPQASGLMDEALANAGLNRYLERAIRALPDRVVDSAVQVDDVLRRAIGSLDLRATLNSLDDPNALNRQVETAVTQAVKDSLIARIKGLLPGG